MISIIHDQFKIYKMTELAAETEKIENLQEEIVTVESSESIESKPEPGPEPEPEDVLSFKDLVSSYCLIYSYSNILLICKV